MIVILEMRYVGNKIYQYLDCGNNLKEWLHDCMTACNHAFIQMGKKNKPI